MKGNRNRKVIVYVYSVLALLAIVTAGLGVTVAALPAMHDDKIIEGISVSGIDLGGKTEKEARRMLARQIGEIKEKTVSISVTSEGKTKGTESVSLADLGLKAKGAEVISEVSKIGKSGNLIARYKAMKDAKEKAEDHKLTFRYDKEKLSKFVNDLAAKYEEKAQNASLKRQNGKFIITAGKIGHKLDSEATVKELKGLVDELVAGLPGSLSEETELELALEVTKPKYNEKELALVKDVLGSYTTNYGSSTTGRAKNVENGCRLVNGTILLPGESASINKKMYPYTIANGYGIGGAYLNGKVVDDVGGGICQVSTTLYNAVLYAELGVPERHNHSMTVTYVPLARDAAIAGDYKDLVIKNTSKYPIYIEGIAGRGNITFNIYGHETRDVKHRKVDFESVTLQTIHPGKDIVTKDPTKPESYLSVTQGSWTGYKSQLYKVVTVNGKRTERTLVNSSNYRANPRHVVKGTKKEEKEEKDGKKDKGEKKDGEKKHEKPKAPVEDEHEDVIIEDEGDE